MGKKDETFVWGFLKGKKVKHLFGDFSEVEEGENRACVSLQENPEMKFSF